MFNFVLLKGRPFQNFTLKKKMDGLVMVRSLHVPIRPKWSQQYQILQNIPKQTFTFQVFQVNHKTEHISWTRNIYEPLRYDFLRSILGVVIILPFLLNFC